MDTNEKIHIEKLKGAENYQTWKVLIKLLLTEKGLKKTIDPESRSAEELTARSAATKANEEEDQEKALAAIGLRVSPEFFGIITDANGSAKIMDEEIHGLCMSSNVKSLKPLDPRLWCKCTSLLPEGDVFRAQRTRGG